jgi:hypothetical protein
MCCFYLLQDDFAPLEDRLRSMLSRMQEIPGMLETSRQSLSDIAPIYAQVALDIVSGGLTFFEETVPGFAAQVPSIQQELIDAAMAAVVALEDYGRWIRETVLPTENADFVQELYPIKLDLSYIPVLQEILKLHSKP